MENTGEQNERMAARTVSVEFAVTYVAVYNPQIHANSRRVMRRHGRVNISVKPPMREAFSFCRPDAFSMMPRSTIVMNGATKKAAPPEERHTGQDKMVKLCSTRFFFVLKQNPRYNFLFWGPLCSHIILVLQILEIWSNKEGAPPVSGT